jgi:hypothetical protein
MAPVALRFKRKDGMTVFLFAEPGESFRKLKMRIADACAVKGGAENVKFFQDDKEKEYADEALVSDFPLVDDSIVYLSLNGESVA